MSLAHVRSFAYAEDGLPAHALVTGGSPGLTDLIRYIRSILEVDLFVMIILIL